MINNKGYVFTTMLLFFIFLIGFVVVLFKQGLIGSANQASHLMGVMDFVDHNQSRNLISFVNNFKLIAYGNLSNSSLVSDFNDSVGGVLISNDPVINLSVAPADFFNGEVNVSYPLSIVEVNLTYPLVDLLVTERSFSEIAIQQCLDNNDCANNRPLFDSILTNCLASVLLNGFKVENSSVPLLIGTTITVDLTLIKEGTNTYLFPYWLGLFDFDC